MEKKKLLRWALTLAYITIFYNVIEGVVSAWFGEQGESFALLGFGFDSFVEVVSGIGIAHLVHKLQKQGTEEQDSFERTALRITGIGFFILTLGLVSTSIYDFATGHHPSTTIAGIIISLLSIITMTWLMQAKKKVGKQLNSPAIISDAACTKVCLYMSVILLISSGLFALTGFPYLDALGGLGLAYYAFNEGRENFEKLRSGANVCSCED